jgi:hypothetical protein
VRGTRAGRRRTGIEEGRLFRRKEPFYLRDYYHCCRHRLLVRKYRCAFALLFSCQPAILRGIKREEKEERKRGKAISRYAAKTLEGAFLLLAALELWLLIELRLRVEICDGGGLSTRGSLANVYILTC